MTIHLTRSIFTAALALTTATAFAADRSFDRNLSVSGSPNVTINTSSGDIHLHPGSDSQIHVAAHMHSSHGFFDGSSGDVESRMQQIANNPPVQQNGNSVSIGERGGDRDHLYRNISIDYDITLPHSATITAGTGSGNVEIQDVGTTIKAETGSGNVTARGIHGAASLETGSGDIELDEAAAGDVRAHTGSGNIHLNGVAGGLNAITGSGDIDIDGSPKSDWKLDTGSGSIKLNVGSSAHFNLDANTGSGSLHIQQPITMQGSLNRNHIAGTVNGGGPTLRAETGSGDIEIR